MSRDKTQVEQYCFRWKQPVSGGILHWYLRRLASDLRFYGHVHIRTDSLSQNRSFDGKLPTAVWKKMARLLDRIKEVGDKGVTKTKYTDGALIEGDAGAGIALIRCNTTDSERSEGASAFYTLVNLLQPLVSNAASLSDEL